MGFTGPAGIVPIGTPTILAGSYTPPQAVTAGSSVTIPFGQVIVNAAVFLSFQSSVVAYVSNVTTTNFTVTFVSV
jgi:hypothetical protein